MAVVMVAVESNYFYFLVYCWIRVSIVHSTFVFGSEKKQFCLRSNYLPDQVSDMLTGNVAK